MTDPIALATARALLESAAREMGIVLQRAAFSPNIKERRDASCALFDATGQLLAQAEHIPVHLGAMQASVTAALEDHPQLGPADAVLLNDPYRGGTHLPDLTLVSPVHVGGQLVGYAANRAHHADVGGSVPGSMPASARDLHEEGVVVPPVLVQRNGQPCRDVLELILRNVRTPDERLGDLRAQLAANATGSKRLAELAARHGTGPFLDLQTDLLDATERAAEAAIRALPAGEATAEDWLEGDGVTDEDLRIRATISLRDGRFTADFAGTAPQAPGNLNAPPPVAEACAVYALLTLVGPDVMANAGLRRRIQVRVPHGSLLNPRPPAAVAGGNVETSQRVTDVLLQAVARIVPQRAGAASQGTMNNVTIGGTGPTGAFTYYETLGGGEGGRAGRPGMSGVHTHMTNTRNTPVEALEHAYPLRVRAYRLRGGSGGAGRHPGGEGLVREIEVLCDEAVVSLITDRRRRGPAGALGGLPGAVGVNALERDGRRTPLPAKTVTRLARGDVLLVETPGGGGWGQP